LVAMTNVHARVVRNIKNVVGENNMKATVRCCFNCKHCFHWVEHGLSVSYHCEEEDPFDPPEDRSITTYEKELQWITDTQTQPDRLCKKYK
jgi:hypothetical protein